MSRIIDRTTKMTVAVAAAMLCSGCAVIAVADAVVTTAAVVVKTGVKVTGAVVDAVIPDSDDEDSD